MVRIVDVGFGTLGWNGRIAVGWRGRVVERLEGWTGREALAVCNGGIWSRLMMGFEDDWWGDGGRRD